MVLLLREVSLKSSQVKQKSKW